MNSPTKEDEKLERRLNDVKVELHEKILAYSVKKWGQDLLEAAVDEFCEISETDFEFGEEAEDLPLFTNWFLFNYAVPDVADAEHDVLLESWRIQKTNYFAPSIAQQFLKDRSAELSDDQRDYLNQQLNARFSFFQVIEIEGTLAKVEDLKNSATYDVILSDAFGEGLKMGFVLFGKCIPFEGQMMGDEMGETAFGEDTRTEVEERLAQINDTREFDDRGPFDYNSSLINLYGFLQQ